MSLTTLMAGMVLLGACLVLWNYRPFRKQMEIRLNPGWKTLARVYDFPEEAEIAEEENLFVSSTLLRDACEVVWAEKQGEPPAVLFKPMEPGTTVHVNAKHVGRFIREVLPKLKTPVVLVSGGDTVDTAVPGYERLIGSPKILHWFLQNFALDPKVLDRVTPIPLGLNFHKLETFPADNTSLEMGFPSRHGNQQLTLKAIREMMPPFTEKPDRVLINFHLSMDTFLRHSEAEKRARARRECLSVLKEKPFVELQARHLPRNEVWRRQADYAFEASPHGNGLDCHRTWEAMLLKTLPIVKTSSLDPLYKGLPVAIVRDWSEVSPTKLQEWRAKFGAQLDGGIPDPLYCRYWVRRFNVYKEH